jgi:hypothetical protein
VAAVPNGRSDPARENLAPGEIGCGEEAIGTAVARRAPWEKGSGRDDGVCGGYGGRRTEVGP